MTMLLIAPESRETKSAAGASSEVVPAERRRGLRIRQNRPVKVYEPTSARYFAGHTCDVSSTGLRVELPAGMLAREGCQITIHVGLNEQGQALANRRSMIPAKIVWVERSFDAAQRPRVMAGVEFVATVAAHLDAA
jgi:hypothetical protein